MRSPARKIILLIIISILVTWVSSYSSILANKAGPVVRVGAGEDYFQDVTDEISAQVDGNDGIRAISLTTLLLIFFVLLVVIYFVFVLRGWLLVRRYQHPVIDICPVCHHGTLDVRVRSNRILGIARPKRVMRCIDCRSVLRETSTNEWRYAVDSYENPGMYEQYNGHVISSTELQSLVQGLRNPFDA